MAPSATALFLISSLIHQNRRTPDEGLHVAIRTRKFEVDIFRVCLQPGEKPIARSKPSDKKCYLCTRFVREMQLIMLGSNTYVNR